MLKDKAIQTVQVDKNTDFFKGFSWNYAFIAVSVLIFIFFCFRLDLIQDDAYISFRYAENYLSGNGLVYNIGERVEGYTNFLWIILLAVFKKLFDIDYITASRFLGMTSGELIFYFIFILLKNFFKKPPFVLYLSIAIALLGNLSLPYWSIASLETSLFACIVLVAVITEYQRSYITPVLLAIATLIRPEGAVAFSAILINRIICDRKQIWYYVIMYAVLLLPFSIFKLVYYGSLLPNTYFAKSGFGIEYIPNGLEYLWHFTSTIGVYGIIFLVPILSIKRLWEKYSLLYIYVSAFILFIVCIGGDVLRVYRFFVPVIPVLYFLFVVSLFDLISLIKISRAKIYGIVLIITMLFSLGSYSLSYKQVLLQQKMEKSLAENMDFMSVMLNKHAGPDFSLAASTIGLVGYRLMGHRVIDMLGLTDAYIAHNPEKIEGMTTGWKERRFNARYLLEQQPEIILFSTGLKPSAPAEQALFLHSEFRRNYSTFGFKRNKLYEMAWKRKGDVDISRDRLNADIGFINKYIDGFNHYNWKKFDLALMDFTEARQKLNSDFILLSFLIGDCYLKIDMIDSSIVYLKQTLKLDSLCWEAKLDMMEISRMKGDSTAALRYANDLMLNTPWIFDRSYQSDGIREEE